MQYRLPLIYARFSDDRTDGSLERQVHELEALAERHGITGAEVIAEDDITGWTVAKERQGRWPEVIDGLSSGRWDCLIVRSLDRCARDVIETIQLARLAEVKGFGFIALNGDKLDRLTAMFRGYASEEESRVKSERLKLKWADKAARGDYHPGRWRPYGYRYTHNDRGVINGLVIDPAEAEIVREVAARLIAGESGHSIALDLERRGVPSVSGAQWQRMSVIRTVKPVCAGLIEHRGQVMPGNHRPIISDLEYWAVWAALKKGDTPARGHNTRKHVLASFLICSRCGCSMQCNGRVYQCTTKTTRNGVRGCGKITVRKTHAEAHVIGAVIDRLREQETVAQSLVTADWTPAIDTAETEVAAIHAAYEAGDITAAEWLAGLKVARQKLTTAHEKRSEQLSAIQGHASLKVSGSDAAERFAELNLSQQRAVLGEQLQAVIVKPGVKGRPKFESSRLEILWR